MVEANNTVWRLEVSGWVRGQGSLGSATYTKNLPTKSLIDIRVVGAVNTSNSAKHFLTYSCRKPQRNCRFQIVQWEDGSRGASLMENCSNSKGRRIRFQHPPNTIFQKRVWKKFWRGTRLERRGSYLMGVSSVPTHPKNVFTGKKVLGSPSRRHYLKPIMSLFHLNNLNSAH